jgi:hypothetical protein
MDRTLEIKKDKLSEALESDEYIMERLHSAYKILMPATS